jgi:hypothetical protein
VHFNNKVTLGFKGFHYTRWKSVVGSTFLPLHPLGGKNYRYQWIGDWVGSKIGMYVVAMRIIMPFKESKPSCPVRITTTAATIFAVYFATLSVPSLQDVEWYGDG